MAPRGADAPRDSVLESPAASNKLPNPAAADSTMKFAISAQANWHEPDLLIIWSSTAMPSYIDA